MIIWFFLGVMQQVFLAFSSRIMGWSPCLSDEMSSRL